MREASRHSLTGFPGTGTGAIASGGACPPRINNVVLVHGAFVDGGGWEAVFRMLKARGYNVSIVQIPTISLAADTAATRAVIELQDGPAVLVGHSYGGAVISEAGNHRQVARLVYLAAFVPDSGESVQALMARLPRGAPMPPMLPPVNGFLRLDCGRFANAFAGDLAAERAEFLAMAQLPWGVDAFTDMVTLPAWRGKPCWYLVATEDRMIAPDVQRAMARRAGAAVAEVASSHAIHESHPGSVAAAIERACRGNA